jgi:multidrug efflux pump subunit AcrA (membrane-fusion protein)
MRARTSSSPACTPQRAGCSAIRRQPQVTRADVPVPFSPVLEKAMDFDVEAGVTGIVDEVLVVEGSVVEVGTVIARIREDA